MVLILVAAVAVAYFILTYKTAPESPAPVVEEGSGVVKEVRLVTWNLYNFGQSKDAQEIAFIAQQLRGYDLVAVQEVSTSLEGAKAVARLDDALDRMGAQWDYVVSEPTTGTGSERYAFLWKPSRVRLVGRGWLEASLEGPIDREPYLARFETPDGDRRMLLASFHAVPTSKEPAREVRLLDRLHGRYPDDHVLIMGDFNLSQQDAAFDGLKRAGYRPVLVDQKTSIKMKEQNGERLASEYDNIFYETAPLRAVRVGVIDFTVQFSTLREARTISDHLPVYMDIAWQ